MIDLDELGRLIKAAEESPPTDDEGYNVVLMLKHMEAEQTLSVALRNAAPELIAMARRYQWGVKHARWLRHEHEAYVAIPVARDADLSCEAMRHAAIDAAIVGAQFAEQARRMQA